tara:strand:+ start:6080 stop:6265 length:186 start_codon:yes stop_codon:yes gene_type:complete
MTQRQGIDRLNDPGVGFSFASQEVVGIAVKQHKDALRSDASGTFLKPEIQTGCHPAHVSDL